MRDPLERLRDVARRSWTDELEAISAVLGAAGVLDKSLAMRRMLARDLVRRRATGDDVLTWVVHHIKNKRGAGWLLQALRRDPEAVWKQREQMQTLTCGVVDQVQRNHVFSIIESLATNKRHA